MVKNSVRTINEMRRVAGKSLTDKIIDFLGKDAARNWFYSPNSWCQNKSPYTLCLKDKMSFVEDCIDGAIHGVYT